MRYSASVKSVAKDFPTKALFLTGVAATMAINPWLAYDPINLPKMFCVSIGGALLLALILTKSIRLTRENLPLTGTATVLAILFIISFCTNDAPWYQQFWGTWGRSTGLLTYFSFIVILIAATQISSDESLKFGRKVFERLGLFITCYTLMQLMELDPINWSQKLMVATLGNINFMSSFLGLVSISYISRIFFENLNLSSKLYFLILTFLNLFLIFVSQSIQGIGVVLAGVTTLITAKLLKLHGKKVSLIFLSISIFAGFLVFIGTTGQGPLAFMRQETVIFRTDYWGAGIRMALANPMNGVGIDSYGDFYREFRSSIATTRTGPQRVTNTSHNIFIDVFANTGIIAGLTLLLVMFLTFVSIVRSLSKKVVNPDYLALSSIWAGFLVFCSISINQIGVGVWGFIFTGLIYGFNSDGNRTAPAAKEIGKLDKVNAMTPKFTKRTNKQEVKSSGKKLNLISMIIVRTLIISTLSYAAFIPNLSDARFLKAFKDNDSDKMIKLFTTPGVQDFHKEQLIVNLRKNGREVEAIRFSRLLLRDNPRNWTAWTVLASSTLVAQSERELALRELIDLDPQNLGLSKEILPLP
jgi:O-antigen ligase